MRHVIIGYTIAWKSPEDAIALPRCVRVDVQAWDSSCTPVRRTRSAWGFTSPSIFDFFTERLLDCTVLSPTFPFLAKLLVLQKQPDSPSVLVAGRDEGREHFEVSFFDKIGFGRIGAPEFTPDRVLFAVHG